MFYVHEGGFGYVATAKFSGRTGHLVKTKMVNGTVEATKFSGAVSATNMPAGFGMIEPDGQLRQKINYTNAPVVHDAFSAGESLVVVKGSGYAACNLFEPGTYLFQDPLTASTNGMLRKAAGDEPVIATIESGNYTFPTPGGLVNITFRFSA